MSVTGGLASHALAVSTSPKLSSADCMDSMARKRDLTFGYRIGTIDGHYLESIKPSPEDDFLIKER